MTTSARVILIRQISWLKGALRGFEALPPEVQRDAAQALSIAARGGKADTAKPFKGLGSGVFEIALRHRGNAYRVIYAAQLDDALWVIHAFQKKSKKGIKTPQIETDVIRERLKRLREALK
jgi:phage-related protein